MSRSLSWTFCFIVLCGSAAASDQGRILQVTKTLSLDQKANSISDYVVDLGLNSGFQVGSILDVYRRLSIPDELDYGSANEMKVWVGQLEVIHSESKLSVSRLRGISGSGERPLLEYPLPMAGDVVEIGVLRKISKSFEKIPGLIFTGKSKGKGKVSVLEDDARKYVRKIAMYLEKNPDTLESLKIVSRSPNYAELVITELRKNLSTIRPRIQVYVQKNSKRVPDRAVAMYIERK